MISAELITVLLLLCNTVLITIVLAILVLGVSKYIRLRCLLAHIVNRTLSVKPRRAKNNMNCDELIDELLEADSMDVVSGPDQHRSHDQTAHGTDRRISESTVSLHRERLAALAAGGQARQYLGKAVTVDQVDTMSDEEIEKLYGRYEARLGAAMTKTLGQAALQIYTGVATMFLPIPPENRPDLIAELEADPFVGHALSTSTCELFHRFGMYLAPLTVMLTTMKHCQFGDQHSQTMVQPSNEDVPTRPDADRVFERRSNEDV